jgi:hypothetical protein
MRRHRVLREDIVRQRGCADEQTEHDHDRVSHAGLLPCVGCEAN